MNNYIPKSIWLLPTKQFILPPPYRGFHSGEPPFHRWKREFGIIIFPGQNPQNTFEEIKYVLKYRLLMVLVLGSSLKLKSQYNDRGISVMAGLQYSFIPHIGDHQLNGQQIDVKMNYPKGNATFYLNSQFVDQNWTLTYNNGTPDLSSFENIKSLSFEFGYTFKIAEGSTLSAFITPTFASNFSAGLNGEDFIGYYGLSLQQNLGPKNAGYDLTVGLWFGPALGYPSLLPLISIHRDISERIDYTLGFPNSELTYKLPKGHSISFESRLDGSYANNSASVSFEPDKTLENSKMIFSRFELGFAHQLQLQRRITATSRIGYATLNKLRIENHWGEVLYDFKPDTSIYFAMGLQINLNK